MSSRYRCNFGRLRGAAAERFDEGARPILPAQVAPFGTSTWCATEATHHHPKLAHR